MFASWCYVVLITIISHNTLCRRQITALNRFIFQKYNASTSTAKTKVITFSDSENKIVLSNNSGQNK